MIVISLVAVLLFGVFMAPAQGAAIDFSGVDLDGVESVVISRSDGDLMLETRAGGELEGFFEGEKLQVFREGSALRVETGPESKAITLHLSIPTKLPTSVSTSYGRIELEVTAPLIETVELETVTGEVLVRLGEMVEMSARTSGRIITDFSMKVEREPREEPDKTAHWGGAQAEPKLRIFTRRGTVSVLERLP